MSRLLSLGYTLWRLFVADTALAMFVPLWALLAWGTLPYVPKAALAAILALAPLAALWLSVRHAARGIRRKPLEVK